jgi:hypothetical protein
MPIIHLPCTKCGAALPITRGSIVQCFICGSQNAFLESFDELSRFALEILPITRIPEEVEDKVNLEQCNNRMKQIDTYFNEYLSKTRQIEYLVISKHDEVEDNTDIQHLGKSIGKLAILIEFFLLPHLENSFQQKQYQEMLILCKIRNVQLHALHLTIIAKKEFRIEQAKDLYRWAQKNYTKAQEYAAEIVKKQNMPDFEEERILSQAAAQFASLLEEFLTANPGYYADELEQIELLIKEFTDSRATTLKKQIIRFYSIGNDIAFLLEDLRNHKLLNNIQPGEERVLYYTQDIRQNLTSARKWLEETDNKFLTTQKILMQLHGGQLLPYLEDSRKEFQTRKQECIAIFNDLISQYFTATISDYALEASEIFELLDAFMDNEEFDAPELVQKFEHYYHEILVLNETIRQFILDLLKYAINENLFELHSVEMVNAISEKSALFDKKVLRFVTLLNERFNDIRNKQQMPLAKQKDLFNIEYRPILEQVVKSSFTLTPDQIAYPIFMEFIILSKAIEVDEEYRTILLLENPSPIILLKVGVTFFVPNSFQIRTRILEIGKLRPGEKLRFENQFTPTQEGHFYIMTMVQYEHAKESFWMPSIKIPLVVGNPPDEDTALEQFYQKHGLKEEDILKLKSYRDNVDYSSTEMDSAEVNEMEESQTVEGRKLAELLKDFDNFDDTEAPDEEK